MAETPPDVDAERRADLTRLQAWAVDSADTTEIDDAVSLEVSRSHPCPISVLTIGERSWLTTDLTSSSFGLVFSSLPIQTPNLYTHRPAMRNLLRGHGKPLLLHS